MVAETRRTHTEVSQGNSEVIQGINHITDKDQFFQGALRINKNLNKHKVKISIDKSGQALLNAEHAINPKTFAASPAADRVTLLRNIGENRNTAPNVSVNLGMDVKTNSLNLTYIKQAVNFTINSAKLIDSFPELSDMSEEALIAMAKRLSGFTEVNYQYLVKIVEEFFKNNTTIIWERIRAMDIQQTELYEKLVCFIIDELKRQAVDKEHIVDELKKFFVDGNISHKKFSLLLNRFHNVINSDYNSIKFREVKCKLCKGIRFSH